MKKLKKKVSVHKYTLKIEEKWFKPVIREKAHYKCEICGETKMQLHVHHIEGKDTNFMRIYEPNGILLCAKCHTFGDIAAHSESSSGQVEFRKRLLNKRGQDSLDSLAFLRRNAPKVDLLWCEEREYYYKQKLNALSNP